MLKSHRAAMELAPQAPLVAFVNGVLLYHRPEGQGGDRARGRRRMLATIARWAADAPRDPHAAIWLPVAWSWLGQAYLGEGRMEDARRAFDAALAVRPDYSFVRNALRPMTEPVRLHPLPHLNEAGWRPLATDPAGDRRFPTLPDLLSLSWQPGSTGERLWFRFELDAAADPDAFGLNLALDRDDDQATGNGWWAGNTDFTYDRLITVWVARGRDGRYRGTVGAADAAEVTSGRYVTSSPGSVVAAVVDHAAPVLHLGIATELVGADGPVRLVATVGSNTQWNDTVPNHGSALMVTLPDQPAGAR